MDPRIKYALEVMEKHCGDHLRPGRIAAAIHLSPSRFEHLFKQEVGQAYKSHLGKLRVRRAQDLLADRRLSVKEVAAVVGYAHPYNLTRAFKQRFGKTPSQYRRGMPYRG